MTIQFLNYKDIKDRYEFFHRTAMLKAALRSNMSQELEDEEWEKLARGLAVKKSNLKIVAPISVSDTIYKGKFVLDFIIFKKQAPSIIQDDSEKIKLIIW